MVGDVIQSIGVVIAAIIIYIHPSIHVVDPICTLIFAVITMIVTWPVF